MPQIALAGQEAPAEYLTQWSNRAFDFISLLNPFIVTRDVNINPSDVLNVIHTDLKSDEKEKLIEFIQNIPGYSSDEAAKGLYHFIFIHQLQLLCTHVNTINKKA